MISLHYPSKPSHNTKLRHYLRLKRRKLCDTQQLNASLKLQRQLLSLPIWSNARNVALYTATDGEISLAPLTRWLWRHSKNAYLPVIDQGRLVFSIITPGNQYQFNRYHIAEPAHTRTVHAQDLDVIIVPLVGFDHQGNRLGMGGGFYDRTLADTASNPYLIGVGHSCQYSTQIERQAWDVTMDGIATPERVFIANQP